MNSQADESLSIQNSALAVMDDPATFFGMSLTKMQMLGAHDREELQRAGLSIRFEQQKERIPMVGKLAQRQGIRRVEDFEEARPLLFEHTMYKSYRLSLLEHNRFDKMTEWLQKLTCHDLSKVDASECASIDEWLDLLQDETELDPLTSSGSTGAMSFLPRGRADWRRSMSVARVASLQEFGADPTEADLHEPIHVIWPTFSDGHIGQFRAGHYQFEHFALRRPEYFHVAYPGKGSADLMFLAARLRAAAARGDTTRVDVPQNLLARRDELEAMQKDMPKRQAEFITEMLYKLQGQRVSAGATWSLFYELATRGLAEGRRCHFAPNSVIVTGGGAKGMTLPDDWQDKIKEFFGLKRLSLAYGMSEITSLNGGCEHGRYHLQPWIIPYVLDPDTSAPLPRKGLQKGRLALFDICMEGHWGGFITGDAVELDFDGGCPCGRQSPHIAPEIYRYSELQGGNDKITCAATPQAHADAMEFLLGG